MTNRHEASAARSPVPYGVCVLSGMAYFHTASLLRGFA